MQRVLTDLAETRTDSPFPGLTTHAYLWTTRRVLFYSPATDADFDDISDLGGVSDQYLSHRDEAGPILARIADRFGSRLHAPAAELAEIGAHARVDVPVSGRHVDANGVEVIATPGHSPGSTCYLVQGTDGSYLFTGDTLYWNASGELVAGYIPPISDAEALAASLDLLATLAPGVVISSAFQGDSAVRRVDPARWRQQVARARADLQAQAR